MKLGGNTVETPGPSWPKGYSISYDVMLSNKLGGSWQGPTAWEPAGHWSLRGDQLFSFASLVFLGIYFSSLLLFSLFLIISFFIIFYF